MGIRCLDKGTIPVLTRSPIFHTYATVYEQKGEYLKRVFGSEDTHKIPFFSAPGILALSLRTKKNEGKKTKNNNHHHHKHTYSK